MPPNSTYCRHLNLNQLHCIISKIFFFKRKWVPFTVCMRAYDLFYKNSAFNIYCFDLCYRAHVFSSSYDGFTCFITFYLYHSHLHAFRWLRFILFIGSCLLYALHQIFEFVQQLWPNFVVFMENQFVFFKCLTTLFMPIYSSSWQLMKWFSCRTVKSQKTGSDEEGKIGRIFQHTNSSTHTQTHMYTIHINQRCNSVGSTNSCRIHVHISFREIKKKNKNNNKWQTGNSENKGQYEKTGHGRRYFCVLSKAIPHRTYMHIRT